MQSGLSGTSSQSSGMTGSQISTFRERTQPSIYGESLGGQMMQSIPEEPEEPPPQVSIKPPPEPEYVPVTEEYAEYQSIAHMPNF